MKTLENHLVLFDDECPMCKVYTQAFVKSGMLEVNGRAAYQNMPAKVCPVVDKQRAVNEIALVNLKTGEVIYGVESLFKIIGNAYPIFKPLFALKPFIYIMSMVYAFISYTRRVIIPGAKPGESFAYQPVLKKHYRIIYLLFTWFFTGLILTAYAHLLIGVVPLGNHLREYAICGGQIIFQGIIISIYAKNKIWDYLGNMMTISFAGSLLLVIPLTINRWVNIPPIVATVCFLIVAGLMFLEHLRRTKLLNLGLILTFTWVFYRLIILGIILN